MNYGRALRLGYAALLVLALTLAWLLLHDPRAPQAPQALHPIIQLNVADISAVAVRNQHDSYGLMVEPGGTIALVAKGDTAPGHYAVDEMRAFIYLLAKLTASQTLATPGRLAEFGLGEPRATLAIILKNGQTLRLNLGNTSATGDGYYLQKEGDDAIYVIGKLTGELMLRTRGDYWSRQLLPAITAQSVNSLTQVQLASRLDPAGNWLLLHTGGAAFELQQPVHGTVLAETAFKQLLLALSGLQADQRVATDAPLAAHGLDQPTHVLRVQWEGRSERIVFAPNPRGGYFLNRTGDPAVFTLSDEKAAFLQLGYRALLGDKVYNGSLAAVSSITVDRLPGHASHRLTVRGEGAQMAGVLDGTPIAYADLGRLLAPLYQIGIVAEVGRDAASRKGIAAALGASAHTTVTVDKRDGTRDRLEFVAKDAQLSYLRFDGHIDFVVYTAAADALVHALTSVQSNPPTPAPAARRTP